VKSQATGDGLNLFPGAVGPKAANKGREAGGPGELGRYFRTLAIRLLDQEDDRHVSARTAADIVREPLEVAASDVHVPVDDEESIGGGGTGGIGRDDHGRPDALPPAVQRRAIGAEVGSEPGNRRKGGPGGCDLVASHRVIARTTGDQAQAQCQSGQRGGRPRHHQVMKRDTTECNSRPNCMRPQQLFWLRHLATVVHQELGRGPPLPFCERL